MKSVRSHRGLRGAAITAVCVAAVLLTACAGGEATEVSSTGSEELASIKVVVAPVQFEPVYIAQQYGYFEEHGLDVEIVPGGVATQNVAMALSGEADIVTSSLAAMTTSIAEGAPFKIISNNGYVGPDSATAGVVVLEDSPIQDVADLAGHTVAINGINSGSEVSVFYAAQDAGIDYTSIERVDIPNTGMATALHEGAVDAVMVSAPYYNQLLAGGGVRVVVEPATKYLAYAPVTLWAVTESWLAENADVADRFNLAMAEAIEFYNDPDNIGAVLDITAEVSQVDRSSLSDESLVGTLSPISIEIHMEAAAKNRDGLVEFGIVENAPDLEDMLWENAPRVD